MKQITTDCLLLNGPPMFGKSVSALIEGPLGFHIRKTPLLATDPDQPLWVCCVCVVFFFFNRLLMFIPIDCFCASLILVDEVLAQFPEHFPEFSTSKCQLLFPAIMLILEIFVVRRLPLESPRLYL
jgi:hypothetical protein